MDTAEKHNWVAGGSYSNIHRVTPSIVVKIVRPKLKEEGLEHPFFREISFFKRMNDRQDRCFHIVECFLTFPDHIFLSYCPNQTVGHRLRPRQEREPGVNGFQGRVSRVKEYEDPALVARWLQQLGSALEYVEKIGFCHNDLHEFNCLLDKDFNLKLTDFGRATTIGQFLEDTMPPRARIIVAGPLKDTYGLCSARTEQFALGSLLYFMVYGHEPYEDTDRELSRSEYDRRFGEMEFPELNRHEVFDELISACWHDVYPTMALAAYDFKRKTKDIAGSIPQYETVDRAKEIKSCEALIRKGILGPELALRYQPFWWKYLHAAKSMFFWKALAGLPRRIWLWLWF
ncbi:kinase domain containing protein [Coccidioides posadasii C735 delta SOWgp]|uniref:Kinase domain containing protein n=1 Tax=Coccidioides posadasii (strain C735) TaxID=222929 RepID=C5NZ99_COCP7|nr:kinase domain containing protein [Coccidioides posadasii C735 delta SOWgp]EER29792.1 kinase domain containing protein [Coccidioides posadasii C735 delta SOWgp]|eukprot:XP_003071937.1 kinase domain containing protein [Coccidioides posadasii C735 delta SOWgp]